MDRISIEDYASKVGAEIGVSDWFVINQEKIDLFANATNDDQYIHTDPVRASSTIYGGTIAHGFLTLSLLSAMFMDAIPLLKGSTTSINYGFNEIRFIAPVPCGARIRGRFTLKDVAERNHGQWRSVLGVTVEIDGEDKPALIAEWITLQT